MKRLLHHRANCGGQIGGIAVDQRADACIDHVLTEARRSQADDQFGQMGLMATHTLQEFRRYLERLGGARGRLKFIDTHWAAFSLLRPEPTLELLTEFERPKPVTLGMAIRKGRHVMHLVLLVAKRSGHACRFESGHITQMEERTESCRAGSAVPDIRDTVWIASAKFQFFDRQSSPMTWDDEPSIDGAVRNTGDRDAVALVRLYMVDVTHDVREARTRPAAKRPSAV